MKIAFFTEGMGIPQQIESGNFRTDVAWQVHLNSDHYSLQQSINSIDGKYDIGIIIPPKNNVQLAWKQLNEIKKHVDKVAIMQEGPNNYWTDYDINTQFDFLQLYTEVDFVLCHNKVDLNYYRGLFPSKSVFIMPPVMVENFKPPERELGPQWIPDDTWPNVIIGGNMCSWYNGLISFIIAKEYNPSGEDIYAPSMGRKIEDEDMIGGLIHLPYMNWSEWIKKLSMFNIGVHMMPTVAAGTFALNCAYLGIPCIGNIKQDTQRICHPDCSFEVDNVYDAKECIKSLRNPSYYNELSNKCKQLYKDNYSPEIFKKHMYSVFNAVLEEN